MHFCGSVWPQYSKYMLVKYHFASFNKQKPPENSPWISKKSSICLVSFKSTEPDRHQTHLTILSFFPSYQSLTMGKANWILIKCQIGQIVSANSCLFPLHESFSFNLVSLYIFPLFIHDTLGSSFMLAPQFENQVLCCSQTEN